MSNFNYNKDNDMAIIKKKSEKAKAVIGEMNNPEDVEEFKRLFIQMYPDDYVKIRKTYSSEERKDKKGKGHPMPRPEIYLSNMYKVATGK